MRPLVTMLPLLSMLAGTGCQLDEAAPQDPRCPKSWHADPTTEGGCAPPDGYTALLYAEFGGSGIYGFVRLVTPCFVGAPGPCGPSMVPQLDVEVYHPTDVVGGVVVDGAVPAASGATSKNGIYKLRLAPGTYTIACRDPFDGRLVTGDTEVKADTLALFAIDLDHAGSPNP
ncbi:MAG: hypothetical protein NT062_26355 [Proteobacteria bacterium]|nr:hypothetical protein [Pseudomonadota bacterium]